MAQITIARPKARRGPGEVLGEKDGPSPAGSSYWSRVLACPREHALAQAGIVKAGDREALTVGWLFHKCLERYYTGLQDLQAGEDLDLLFDPKSNASRVAMEVTASKRALEVLAPFAEEDGYAETVAMVEKLATSYFGHYRGADLWRILAVEEQLAVWSLPYTARLDLVVEDRRKRRTYIVEHKTGRSFNADAINGYGLNWQVTGQAYLFDRVVDASRYAPFAGVVVNMTTKTQTPKHLRVEVLPDPRRLDAFEAMVKIWKRVHAVYEKLGWPPDLTKCAGYARGYSTCQYFDLCYHHLDVPVEKLAAGKLPMGYTLGSSIDEDVDE